MMWAVYTLGGKPLLARYSPLELNALTMVPGTLFLALISVPQISNQDWAAVTPGAWAALRPYSTIFAVVVGYVLVVYRCAADRRRADGDLLEFDAVRRVVSAVCSWATDCVRLQLVGALVVISGIWLTRRGRMGSRIRTPLMLATLVKLAYQLRHHCLGEWPLDRWTATLALIAAAIDPAAPACAHRPQTPLRSR